MLAAPREEVEYACRTWQIEEGLPQNFVEAIAQSSDGYLWIGTQKGPARFDGTQFTTVLPPNQQTTKSLSVTALYSSRDGSLWMGSAATGLFRMQDGQWTFQNDNREVIGHAVRTIFEGRDGTLWVGTTNGVARFEHGHFTNLSTNDHLAYPVIRGICEDANGTVWIATAGGVNYWKDGHLFLFHPEIVPRSIYADSKGNLWIGAVNGLYRVRENKVTRFSTEDGLSDNQITALCEDRAGNLWVGSYSGLNRITNGKIETQLTSENQPFDHVNTIFLDREGSIWVGSRSGLARITPKLFFCYTKDRGLSHNNVISVCEVKDGTIWAGTWGGGLSYSKDDRFVPWTKTSSSKLILALCDPKDGALYFGTDYERGMYLINYPVNHGIFHYGEDAGIVDAAVKVIYIDRKKRLWAGTSLSLDGRLERTKSDRFTRFTPREGLAGVPVNAIQEDKQGRLWIGTGGGLSCWDEGKFTNFTVRDGLSHNFITAVYEDTEGTLWLGTDGGGLNGFHDGKFTSYTSKDGLFSDSIYDILEDNEGSFWITCREGIFSLRKSDLWALDAKTTSSITCRVYGKADGLLSVNCNRVAKPATWKGSDGRLWFATSKGLAVVSPKRAALRNELPPPVVIEEIIADKKPVGKISRFEVSSSTPRNSRTSNFKPETLNFPPGRGELEFQYAALSFRAPEKNHFKFKLEGVDADWVDAGTRKIAYYNNIRPGSYQFRVIASNNDGVWNEVGATLAVRLLPHFWQTTWFFTLMALAAVGSVAATARYVTRRRMQANLLRLRQEHAVEKERTRIARDMHDDLGARLSEILLTSSCAIRNKSISNETKTQIERISQSAREVIDNLDGIVWAVDPKNDSLDVVIPYLQEYVEAYLKLTTIRCRLDFPNQLPRCSLSSEVRHNLFMVVKEALHNIVKYAEATETTVRLKVEESILHVMIEDNGQGFCFEKAAGTGNGLQNMEKRMKSIGGSFSVASESGKGTVIRLQIVLQRW